MGQMRVGIIGGGSIAKAHVIGLRSLRSYFGAEGYSPEVAVVADVNPEAAKLAAEAYGIGRWTTDWQAVLGDDGIEAVTIAAPNYEHEPIAVAAAAAGKHVLCEKPMAHTIESARRMVAAVERAGIVHSVHFNYRSIPAMRYARKLIGEGVLGEVVGFRGAFLQDWGLDATVPRSWKFEKGRAGGGPMLSLGCHVVDLAHHLVGPIAAVTAVVTTKITSRPKQRGLDTYAGAGAEPAEMLPVDIEDLGAALVRFGGGAVGTLEFSRITAGRKNYAFIEVSGTKGALVFDCEHMNELQLSTEASPGRGFTRVTVGPKEDGGLFWTLTGLSVGFAETVTLHMLDFVRAIEGKDAAVPSFRDGLRAQEVIHAALVSAETGRWESVRQV
jgi:predicted dehydrogenase